MIRTVLFLFSAAIVALGQEGPRLSLSQIATNGDVTLRLTDSGSSLVTLERSLDLKGWEPLSTLRTSETQFVDSGAVFQSNGFYRGLQETGTNVLAGDRLATTNGPITIRPVNHASFLLHWQGLAIYNDPVGGASPYSTFPRADLILVSHEHSDHYDRPTLTALRKTNLSTIIIAPRVVYNQLNAELKEITTVLTNGAATNVLGIQIEAVPAYNGNHPRGNGNGYVLEIGGKRFYMSGDTGAVAEMRSLTNIDVAFVSMNVPFTMTVSQAAAILRDFAPKVVYPYHYRNQDGTFADLNALRRQIGTDRAIEVRPRKWY